jgi:anti-anti-sigma factor
MSPPRARPAANSPVRSWLAATPRFTGRRYRTRGWPCARPSVFGILVVYARDDVLLQLSGRLDPEASQAFDECVAAAVAEHPRRIAIDCSALDSVDLSSVDCFIRAQRDAADAGIQLVLDSPNPEVQRVLREAVIYDGFVIR